MFENEIRDLLITQLNIFNDDLVFLEKERYLPSEFGTKSFIDILAKDNSNRFVIIELKRSRSASREAIHEIFKYIHAIKENMSLKDDEIKCLIVSTEWEELIVPFSALISKSNIEIMGYKLIIKENNILKAIPIKPIESVNDRIFSAVQSVRYYKDRNNLSNGIKSHIKCFNDHGINDFVLVILQAPENWRDNVIESVRRSLSDISTQFGLQDDNDEINSLLGKIDDYKYIIYSANQLLSLDRYIKIISSIGDYNDSLTEILNDSNLSYLDKLENLNYLLWESEPFPESDRVEIGTPAKFTKFTENNGWKVVEILKQGAISENELLADEIILNEIKGSAGTTGEKYNSIIDIQSKTNISRVKNEATNCLSDNRIWRNHFVNIIDILYGEKDKITYCRCSIYNPMNIIYTLFLILSSDQGYLYIPSYQIEVGLDEELRMYIGYLKQYESKKRKLREIFEEFYKMGEDEFLFSLTWGGYNSINVDICKFLGLNYCTALIVRKKDEIKYYNYEDFSFIEEGRFIPHEQILQFIESEPELIEEIINFFNEHSIGGMMIS